MKPFVELLCGDKCAGRATGTPGGKFARSLVESEFGTMGYEPELQHIAECGGDNVIARLPGAIDRWVLVGAHFDHLGTHDGSVYRGADDNAAAVAILMEVARHLKHRPPRMRGVLFVSFDAEEPPNFMTSAMGSEHFAAHPPVPLDTIDMMLCMDLVGHALGPPGLPDEVRQTVFALGAERSEGTGAHVDRLARVQPGVVVRRADAESIPPLSDYNAFWHRGVPFLFLSCGRSSVYHTPEDVPEKLDYAKMQALARWLERWVRETCERPGPRIAVRRGRDDASTLRAMIDLTGALAKVSPLAVPGAARAKSLLVACSADGRLPDARRVELMTLVGMLEQGLG